MKTANRPPSAPGMDLGERPRSRSGASGPSPAPATPKSGPTVTNITFAVPASKPKGSTRSTAAVVSPSTVLSVPATSTHPRTPSPSAMQVDLSSIGKTTAKPSIRLNSARKATTGPASPGGRKDTATPPPPTPGKSPLLSSRLAPPTSASSTVSQRRTPSPQPLSVRAPSPQVVGHRRTPSDGGKASSASNSTPASARTPLTGRPSDSTLEGNDLYAAYEQMVTELDKSPASSMNVAELSAALAGIPPLPPSSGSTPDLGDSIHSADVGSTPSQSRPRTASSHSNNQFNLNAEDEVEDDVDDEVLDASDDEGDMIGVVIDPDRWNNINQMVVETLTQSLAALSHKSSSGDVSARADDLNAKLGAAMGAGNRERLALAASRHSIVVPGLDTLRRGSADDDGALEMNRRDHGWEEGESLSAGLSMLKRPPPKPKTTVTLTAPGGSAALTATPSAQDLLSSGLFDTQPDQVIDVVLWHTKCDRDGSRDDLSISLSASWTDHHHSEFDDTASLVKTKIRFGRRLARGAAGKVFLGVIEGRTGTDSEVAIKQIRLHGTPVEYERSVQLEVSILKLLCHPNVVRYYGLHQSPNGMTANIILEFVDGGSLGHLLADRVPSSFSEPEVANIIVQTLRGLSYLHSKKIIHRDVKPLNLLVTKKGVVKITDFGLSTQVLQTCSLRRTIVGTPWYVAPEVVMAQPYSFQADIWSVGCVCSELVTGKRPYSGLVGVAAMYRMCQDPIPPLPDTGLSDRCRDFIMKCWVKDWRDRPTADELLKHDFLKLARDAGPRWAPVDV
eukprot:TRINITY_DN841_c0_g1_i1.p1 TRINITY_DN841_c0_g1~~TRINITY_DN841_c0_g1_i1.p1  ORF type:complete len:789 (-),score=157.57 TRINITY_DN841_c0_g1_i1:606-2972(-)